MNQTFQREMDVVTPEQVRLKFQTAGIGSRAGAQAIDMLLLGLVILLVYAIFGEVLIRTGENLLTEYAAAGAIALAFLLQYGYFTVSEYVAGRTIGKRIVGLRVLQDNGQPVTVLSSLIRNLLRIFDFLPVGYTLGAIISFLHPLDKRLGDLLAGTVVVYDTAGERGRRNKRTNKVIERRRASLPDFALEERHKRLVNREDWLLLRTFIDRLELMDGYSLRTIAPQIVSHFTAKLELSPGELPALPPEDVLVALYEQLRGDWEL